MALISFFVCTANDEDKIYNCKTKYLLEDRNQRKMNMNHLFRIAISEIKFVDIAMKTINRHGFGVYARENTLLLYRLRD